MLNFLEWMKENRIATMENLSLESKPKTSDILYVGAILTKDSQEALYHSISKRVAIPADWKKFCHHMTIQFKPSSEGNWVFGEDLTLIVTEIAADEKGIAVRVEPNTNNRELHMPPDQIPHITVACSPGTPPVYSNELLRRGGSGMKMPQALPLAAFIGARMKNGKIMPERADVASENFTPKSELASQQ